MNFIKNELSLKQCKILKLNEIEREEIFKEVYFITPLKQRSIFAFYIDKIRDADS